MIGSAVLFAALAMGSGGTVTLGIYVESDGATYLWHNGAAGFGDFYSYRIVGDGVDVDGWKSISEYVAEGDGGLVAAVLGEQALEFQQWFATGNAVGEYGRGSISPGEMFYIGKPFLTVPPVNYVALGTQWPEEAVRLEITYDPTVFMGSDFNRDGSINLDDFAILKANFGTAGSPRHGDAKPDGRVDLADFGLLKANFGRTAAVPEPASWLLATLAGVGLVGVRSRGLRSGGRRPK